MSNSYFQFRQFTVHQERCAMKVGTDGTLLGAWAAGGKMILDIGTGTGLIAMMMAQRFPESTVVGIDIDDDAINQAKENVAGSPFGGRIRIEKTDVQSFYHCEKFDSIVSNPPYFVNSLTCPDSQRTLARHNGTLSYSQLFTSVTRLLSDNGIFSLIIPFDCKPRLDSEAFMHGFFAIESVAVRTTETKPARRYLLSFARSQINPYRQSEIIISDTEYDRLLEPFYLKKQKK